MKTQSKGRIMADLEEYVSALNAQSNLLMDVLPRINNPVCDADSILVVHAQLLEQHARLVRPDRLDAVSRALLTHAVDRMRIPEEVSRRVDAKVIRGADILAFYRAFSQEYFPWRSSNVENLDSIVDVAAPDWWEATIKDAAELRDRNKDRIDLFDYACGSVFVMLLMALRDVGALTRFKVGPESSRAHESAAILARGVIALLFENIKDPALLADIFVEMQKFVG